MAKAKRSEESKTKAMDRVYSQGYRKGRKAGIAHALRLAAEGRAPKA